MSSTYEEFSVFMEFDTFCYCLPSLSSLSSSRHLRIKLITSSVKIFASRIFSPICWQMSTSIIILSSSCHWLAQVGKLLNFIFVKRKLEHNTDLHIIWLEFYNEKKNTPLVSNNSLDGFDSLVCISQS